MAGKGASVGARNSRLGSFLLATRCLTPSPFPFSPSPPTTWGAIPWVTHLKTRKRIIDVCLSASQGCDRFKRAMAKMNSTFYPEGQNKSFGPMPASTPCVPRELPLG